MFYSAILFVTFFAVFAAGADNSYTAGIDVGDENVGYFQMKIVAGTGINKF